MSSEHHESFLRPREHISQRQEIIAPPHFVSIFHETRSELLDAIDAHGLQPDQGGKNIGEAPPTKQANILIDSYRPDDLKQKGISRNNIYAYPFLEYGHGLVGADQRFINRDTQSLRKEFETIEKYNPAYLRTLGVDSCEEYVRKLTDPAYLQSQYPGEVVEAKVDPSTCYVGDLDYITRIMEDLRTQHPGDAVVRDTIKKYWEDIMSLDEFLKWYRKPEWAQDGDTIQDADQYRDGEPLDTASFYPLVGAPEHLPWRIHQPEILVPTPIPAEHIRLVQ